MANQEKAKKMIEMKKRSDVLDSFLYFSRNIVCGSISR